MQFYGFIPASCVCGALRYLTEPQVSQHTHDSITLRTSHICFYKWVEHKWNFQQIVLTNGEKKKNSIVLFNRTLLTSHSRLSSKKACPRTSPSAHCSTCSSTTTSMTTSTWQKRSFTQLLVSSASFFLPSPRKFSNFRKAQHRPWKTRLCAASDILSSTSKNF